MLDKAWEKFINEHYVLYGRHVKIVTYQGQCQSVPPKYDCLIPEMRVNEATTGGLGRHRRHAILSPTRVAGRAHLRGLSWGARKMGCPMSGQQAGRLKIRQVAWEGRSAASPIPQFPED